MPAKIVFILALFLFLSITAYAQVDFSLRDKVMEAALYAMEVKMQPSLPALTAPDRNFFMQDKRQVSLEKEESSLAQGFAQEAGWRTQRFGPDDIINKAYLTLSLQFGYLKGNTAYDFNHHASELEFPMDNWMGSGGLGFGYKNLSFNTEVWIPLEDYAGFEMKDKDWTNGVLTSYTKSKAYMEALIGDVNLRYDFYKKVSPEVEEDNASEKMWPPGAQKLKFDEIKIGILLGYRYERFDYDLYDLWYWPDSQGATTHQDQIIGTYKIKYYLPYLGAGVDLLREKTGLGFIIKYSFYPTAEDVDNHLLRGLTFYADYDKHREGVMGSIYGFWEFTKDWKLKLSADGTFIRIDGRTWEASRDPDWDADQSTDMKHWIFCSGIEYKF